MKRLDCFGDDTAVDEPKIPKRLVMRSYNLCMLHDFIQLI